MNIQTGRVRLLATEQTLLIVERQAVEELQVVYPALGDAERAAGARLAVGNDGAVVLIFRFRVTGSIDEAGEVEAVAVDERRRFTSHRHVALDRIPELELRLPTQILVLRVDPQEQFFLRSLRHLAIR